jgi:hypothetical protein
MRLGIALLMAVLALAADAASQTPSPPPAEPQPRLRFDTTIPVPTTERRETTVDWTAGLDVRATCPSCLDERRPPVVNGNAPWLWSARWSGGSADTRVSFGVVGQRNTWLPLFMTQPIGGEPLPEVPSSLTPMGDTRTQWQLTLGAEQTLLRRGTGPSLGVLGEAFLPLPSLGAAARTENAPAPAKRAFRGGFRVRF